MRWEPTLVTKPCTFCGTDVTRTYKLMMAARIYCSSTCASKHKAQLGLLKGRKPRERVNKPCEVCGKEVERLVSQTKENKGIFCSRSCVAKYYSPKRIADGTLVLRNNNQQPTREPRNCVVCGTEFLIKPHEVVRGRILCSPQCSNIWKGRGKAEKTCETCGKLFKVSPSRSAVAKYCSFECSKRPAKNPIDRFVNGRQARLNNYGYVLIWMPDHPNKSQKGWQLEHRVVMEQKLGRYLTSKEAVHHINHIKTDNRPENLEVMDPLEHAALSLKDWHKELNGKLSETERLKLQLAEYEKRFGPLT